MTWAYLYRFCDLVRYNVMPNGKLKTLNGKLAGVSSMPIAAGTAFVPLLMLLGAVCAHPMATVVVHTADGPVRGMATDQWRSFRGIPFAAPPVGHLRWTPPQPPKSWTEPLDATEYRHNCFQSPQFDPAQPRPTVSEDCLYLNVFTPANASSKSQLPVMFWVHGGGYQGGGSNESRLNGIFSASLTNDMVIVVANYRLNIFGFLGSTELRDRDQDSHSTGNYGILDQRAALKWCQANIRSFGGDPSRVLLVGESAGGASVHNHLVRQKSWGLFSRAAIESGGYTLVHPQPDVHEMEMRYKQLLISTNCSSSTCLEKISADELLRHDHGEFEPAVDNVDLTAPIVSLFQSGSIAPKVPVLAGSVREDLGFLLPNIQCKPDACSIEDFHKFSEACHKLFPRINVSEMVEIYSNVEVKLPGGNYTKFYWAAKHAAADATMICPARRTLMWSSPLSQATFLYHFTHVPGGSSGTYPKLAHHACEIPFVFHILSASGPNADEYFMHGQEEVRLSAAMTRYWRNFASSGNPNVHAEAQDSLNESLIKWPHYDHQKSDVTMVFADSPKTESGLKRRQCDMWDKVFNWV